jgi:putative membrane protein
MFGLQNFTWSAQWSPFFLLFVVGVGVAYGLAVGKYRHRIPGSEPVERKKKLLFYSGLAVVYVAFGSPIDLLGHMIFSAHMVSMSLAYLIAPPLLLIGLPEWMLRPAVQRLKSSPIGFLINPIVALFLFNGLFSFYHWPSVHDYVMVHYLLHTIYYIVLFMTALLMWWFMITPVPDMRQLGDLKQLAYVFANGVLLTPACALIIFAGAPVYGTYTDAEAWVQAMGFCAPGMDPALLIERFGGPQYFALFPPINDQQLGGVIMKLTQETMYGSILYYGLRRWYRRENREDRLDEGTELNLEPGGLNRA